MLLKRVCSTNNDALITLREKSLFLVTFSKVYEITELYTYLRRMLIVLLFQLTKFQRPPFCQSQLRDGWYS